MTNGADDDHDRARAVALAEELGAQLGRMKGGGPKLRQFLSMVQFDSGRGPSALGALGGDAAAVPFGRVKKVIEQDCDGKLRTLFSAFDEEPFALSSLGQVHRARTADGADVAVKVQRPGAAEAVEADLRSLGIVGPILKRLAPGLDAGAVLDELRERISDELDYEIEGQHQRRLARRFRGHPHVHVPQVDTALSARRVLVTEYVEGERLDALEHLGDAERDRVGEIAFRFFFGLAGRDGTVAGDPHVDNGLLCPDGRLCLFDFGLLRDLDAVYTEGERVIARALAAADAPAVHAGLSTLGYLPDAGTFDPAALLEHLGTASEWMLTPGVRRIDREQVDQVLEQGYPPRSPHFATMRRMSLPAPTLLLRRMELQVLSLLGELHAAADWGTISAEYHSGTGPSTPLGREDRAFFKP